MKLNSFIFAVTLMTKGVCFASQIDGWILAGSNPKDYDVSKDSKVSHSGKSSAVLASNKSSIQGFGTLMQVMSASSYLGKRVRMTGHIKVDNITGSAQMWMRVDAKDSQQPLSFDNMDNRPIKSGVDWTKCEIVLDVPANSSAIAFGVLLNGTGKIWFDDVKIEVVGNSVPLTQVKSTPQLPVEPHNLDFEK